LLYWKLKEANVNTGKAIIRLLLLDSHTVVRTALRHFLEMMGRHVVGDAGDVTQALALAVRLKPDVVLMEAQFPHGDAVQACRDIRKVLPSARVIFLAGTANGTLRIDCMLAGAHAWLSKDAGVDELVRVIDSAGSQDRTRDGADAVPAGAGMAGLTPQETRILPLVAHGLTNRQIGDALGLSHKTVKNHLSSMFQKLQVNRRAQLAALVASGLRN
jgi:DNA-binding NarL/FixJ family response regulator